MKTDAYFWPKEITADPYLKQFIEKTRYRKHYFSKLMYNYISRSRLRSREKNTRLRSRSRGKMARLRNPANMCVFSPEPVSLLLPDPDLPKWCHPDPYPYLSQQVLSVTAWICLQNLNFRKVYNRFWIRIRLLFVTWIRICIKSMVHRYISIPENRQLF